MVNLSETVVLKEGDVFLVALRDGTVPIADGHPLGLYMNDCRFLSGHELLVGGARPRLLVASAPTGAEAVHELTNPDLTLFDGRRLPLQSLQIRIDRSLAEPTLLHERVHVHLYGRETLTLDVDFALSADFQPMFAVRGIIPAIRHPVTVERFDHGLRFAARGGDGVIRSTTVTAHPAPTLVTDGCLRFSLALERGEQADIHLSYELSESSEPSAPPAARAAPSWRAADSAPDDNTRVVADDELFGRVVERSLLDLRMLRSSLEGQTYFAAGIPWFATLFGRDSLITAIEMLAFDSRIAEQTLRVLAQRLGEKVDPVHEEEPGKVIHELRGGEPAALDLTPLTRYYGTVDATPLFLCLLAEHAHWSGNLSLFRELRGAVDATLGWIDRHGDHDGDGLLDYCAGTPRGLRNQGWKDSDDGIVHADGSLLEPPIALVEPQGYVVRAKRAIARLFDLDGDHERAALLRGQAGEMQARLERFWIAEGRYYSMGIDGDARPSSALASNQGHLLWAGAVDEQRAGAIRDALMGEDMFSGWGIRTLARDEAAFNPVGYHLGTVWPHDTAIAAVGLRHYGYDEDFMRLFEGLLEAASHADGYRLPELFAGFSRTQFETPVPYPVACHPQAWASATIPFLLTSALGLEADALNGRLRIRRPSLPRWVNRVEAQNIHIGSARVDLLFERTGSGDQVALTDSTIHGDLEVILEISAKRRRPQH